MLGRGEPYSAPLQKILGMEVDTLSGADIRVLTDFLSSMLQMDQNDRVSLNDLLSHRWLASEVTSRNNPCICGTGYGRSETTKDS